jgi:ADP-ribose pyrophosphatase
MDRDWQVKKCKIDVTNWTQVEERYILRNKWVSVRNDLTRRPDGVIVEFVVLETKDFVGVIPQTSDGSVVLIRQHRYPWGITSWEAPAGLFELPESPETAARREVREETGYEITTSEFLLKFHSNATSRGWGHLYFAEVEHVGPQDLDDNEFIEVGTFTPSEVDDLIAVGEIIHGATLLGWMAAKDRGLIG